MFTAALFTTAESRNNPNVYPSTGGISATWYAHVNGISFVKKKEGRPGTYYNTNEPWERDAERKKPTKKTTDCTMLSYETPRTGESTWEVD